MGLYVQYGCGLSAPEGWINFDSSPTLRLQKISIIGGFFKGKVLFPENIRFGDIIKRLPGIKTNSCDGIYCSHVLEHLSLTDCRIAIKNSYDLLKPGGCFRCVVPSLEAAVNKYIELLKTNPDTASIAFMNYTLLGLTKRERSIKNMILSFWGNSHHLWMWDKHSLLKELQSVGFTSVRVCQFNDSKDKKFILVENANRFNDAVAIEAIK